MNCCLSRLLSFTLLLSASITPTPAQTAAKTAGATAATSAAATANLLDINTATPAQLKALKGIGDAYAKRIIDGRPYTAKNQLTTRGILPPAAYDGIRDRIVAHAVKK